MFATTILQNAVFNPVKESTNMRVCLAKASHTCAVATNHCFIVLNDDSWAQWRRCSITMINLSNKAGLFEGLPLMTDNPASCEVLVTLHGFEVLHLLKCCKAGCVQVHRDVSITATQGRHYLS